MPKASNTVRHLPPRARTETDVSVRTATRLRTQSALRAAPPTALCRVEIVTSQEVVEVGLRTVLETTPASFVVSTSRSAKPRPDVVLYDLQRLQNGHGSELTRWLTDSATTVIGIDPTPRPDLGARGRDLGVTWTITLDVTAVELMSLVQAVMQATLKDSPDAHGRRSPNYLGAEAGLSRRESDVLALIVEGLSNQEIATHLFVSINSVKAYIRSAYRKIGVTRRTQAVTWAIRHESASATRGLLSRAK